MKSLNQAIGKKIRCASCGAGFAPGAEADSRDPEHPTHCRGCAGHVFKELDVSNANNFAIVVAVLNALEQIGHRGGDRNSRQLALSAAVELRSIVPAAVLDAPRLTKLHPLFDDHLSFCSMVCAEFPIKDRVPERFGLLNQYGWTVQEVCENIPGTERSEDTEWISDVTGEVQRLTYHFADSSGLHVYPTLGHWEPS